MSEPKTTIDLPFSPEDVRMGRHLGNAIAGYRDGDFKRSAEGMVDAVRAFQAAVAEIERLRAENGDHLAMNGYLNAEMDRLRAEVVELKAENEQLRIDKITLGNFGCLPAYRTAPPGKEE